MLETTLTVQPKKPIKYNYFIGIDISKNKLDYTVLCQKDMLFHQEGKNESDNIANFLCELKRLPKFSLRKAIFCMEHTGIYSNHLLTTLKKLKANIVIENPLQIKNSMGVIRGKNDKVDSLRIAQYAEKNCADLRLWNPRRPVINELASLYALRNRLLSVQVALKNPLAEEKVFSNKKLDAINSELCHRSIDSILKDLFEINSRIDELIISDLRLKRLFEIITSVPNVGKITAIAIINATNEFKDISCPKKFACYSGVAPFVRESGIFKGKGKISHIGNRKIKTLLHTCALSALRFDEQMRAYFIKKTQLQGKPKMSAINAIRNKLIIRIFACVNQDKLFEKKHLPEEITAS